VDGEDLLALYQGREVDVDVPVKPSGPGRSNFKKKRVKTRGSVGSAISFTQFYAPSNVLKVRLGKIIDYRSDNRRF
jgi:hypothetical protein